MVGVTMGELCAHLRNYFTAPCDRHPGTYTVSGNSISPCGFLSPGQYFRVIGSAENDGVYRYGSGGSSLRDETFTGCIWAMRVPPALDALLCEISAWQETYGEAENSPYSSESFAGYRYTKAARGQRAGAAYQSGWRGAFAARLAPWRKQTV